MRETASVRRWDIWLPAVGLVVATALVVLGAAAARALSERHALSLDGRLLRLAHRAERELRDSGPSAAREVLERLLADGAGLVVGLALVDDAGDVELRVGTEPAAGLPATGSPAARSWDVELHLGRGWQHFRGRGPHGRRQLRIAADPQALEQTPSERLLLPVAALAGVALAALSVLGGRLLVRQQREQQSEAARRRMEGLTRAGAGLAHQLRTPLATIKGSCQLLLESAKGPGEKRLQAAVSQVQRMEKMLQQLLDYARPPDAEPTAVDLDAAMRELADLDPRVRPRVARGVEARVDPEHLREILINLTGNALQASPGEEPVEVAAEDHGRFVEVRVADRGPGPGDDPERLFEPYVSRRADGTGLGLPIARSLAEANGGNIELTARPGGGTVAVLRIPCAEAAA